MESAEKISFSERFNIRLIIFLLAILAPVGWIVYTYVDAVVSGGIHDRGSYIEADLKAMSLFPFDQTNGTINDVPRQWRELEGKRVQVVGEMYLRNSAGDEVRNFELVYSIAKCCFQGSPQIQHFVQARGANGPLPYYSGLVRCTGTLHVKVKNSEHGVTQVYAMDIDQLEPVR